MAYPLDRQPASQVELVKPMPDLIREFQEVAKALRRAESEPTPIRAARMTGMHTR